MPGSKRQDGQRHPSYLLPAMIPLISRRRQSMPVIPVETTKSSAGSRIQSFRSGIASTASSLSSSLSPSLSSPLSSSPSSSVSSTSSQGSTSTQTPSSSLCTTPALPIPELPELVHDTASSSSPSPPPIFAFEPPQHFEHSRSKGSSPFARGKRHLQQQQGQVGGEGEGRGPRHNRRVTRTAPDVLRCLKCSADIAFSAQIVSKGFTGRHGRAYLVSAPSTCPDHLMAPEASPTPTTVEEDEEGLEKNLLINIRVGRPEQRQLATGAHIVADIYCAMCSTKLGWKYVDAHDAAQRYKVGKFILEVTRVAATRGWEDIEFHQESSEQSDKVGNHASGPPVESRWVPMPASDYSLFDLTGEARKHTTNSSSGNGKQLNDTAYGCFGLSDKEETIEFDSENEDECDDIFAGTWDRTVVAKRRAEKLASVQGTR